MLWKDIGNLEVVFSQPDIVFKNKIRELEVSRLASKEGTRKMFSMIIGKFNIRGGCSFMKRRHIHQIISTGKAGIFLIQGKKLKSCSVSTARSFWREEGIDFSASNSECMSGRSHYFMEF